MRPPLNAGENARIQRGYERRGRGFNEAPAERGGKRLRRPEQLRQPGAASMRPPLNAGENANAASSLPSTTLMLQ